MTAEIDREPALERSKGFRQREAPPNGSAKVDTRLVQPILAFKEGRDLFYRLNKEDMYSSAERAFIAKRYSELSERMSRSLAPRVILVCDKPLHFVANAVLLTLLGCEVEGCRDLGKATQLCAPQHRPIEYLPPELIIFEKTQPAKSGVDFSPRDFFFNLRWRDAQYTRDSGFICRSNIVAIASPGVSIFDATDAGADIVLRGTLFRNLAMIRRLLLPESIINQNRLHVHRAVANYSRIERLLMPAPCAPDTDGTVRVDDADTRALALQRVAGGLEEEVTYLRDVLRYKDTEVADLKKKRERDAADRDAAAEKLQDTIRLLRRDVAALEEDKSRLLANVAKLQSDAKAATNQTKLMQVQMQTKTKLTKIRSIAASDSINLAPASPVDDATDRALMKMRYSTMRSAAMSPASSEAAVQCLILTGTPQVKKSPPVLPSVESRMIPGIPVVDEVISVRAPDVHAQCDAQRASLEAAQKRAEERALALSTQLIDLQAKLTTAQVAERDVRASLTAALGKLEPLAFENGRLQEMVEIARQDRSTAQQHEEASARENATLHERIALLEGRLRDDESIIVQKRVALEAEAQGNKAAQHQATLDERRVARKQRGKELLLRCVLLAALTKRQQQTDVLTKAIAAAEAKAAELKATIKEAKNGGGKGGTKLSKDDSSPSSSPASTGKPKHVEVEPDPSRDLWVLFQKQAQAMLEIESANSRLTKMYQDARALMNPIEKSLDAARSELAAAVKAKATAEEAAEKAIKDAATAKEEVDHHNYMSVKFKGDIADLKEQLAAALRSVTVATQQTQAAVQAAKEFDTENARHKLQCGELGKRVAELEALLSASTKELNGMKDEAKTIHKSSLLHQRLSTETSARLTAAEQIAAEASAELEKQRARVSELEAKNASLKRKVAERKPQSEEVEVQLPAPRDSPPRASSKQPATSPIDGHEVPSIIDGSHVAPVADHVVGDAPADRMHPTVTAGGAAAHFGTMESSVLAAEVPPPMMVDAVADPSQSSSAMTTAQSSPSALRSGSDQPAAAQIIFRTRVVVGAADETEVTRLRLELADSKNANAELEERLKNLKRDVAESRGLIGTYKDSQMQLKRTAETAAETLADVQRQAEELARDRRDAEERKMRNAPLRKAVADAVATWQDVSRGEPLPTDDDGSAGWVYSAAGHCLGQALQVVSLMNRIRVATIDNSSQTAAYAGGGAKTFADVGVTHRPLAFDVGTHMATAESIDSVCQTAPAPLCRDADTETLSVPPAVRAMNETASQTDHVAATQAVRAAPESSRPQTVSDITEPFPRESMELSSRQLSRVGDRPRVQAALASRDRTTRLPIIDDDRRIIGTPLLADNSNGVTPVAQRGAAARRAVAQLSSSGAAGFEPLFETAAAATQTDNSSPAPVASCDQSCQCDEDPAVIEPGSPSLKASHVKRVSLVNSSTAVTPSAVTPRPETAAVEIQCAPHHANRSTAVTPVAAAATAPPARPVPRLAVATVDATAQTRKVPATSAAIQVTPAPLSVAAGHSQTAKIPTATVGVLARRSTSDMGVQVGGGLVESASVKDAVPKLVAATMNVHRALHALFLRVKSTVPTAADLALPPIAAAPTAKTALEALAADATAAAVVTECLTAYTKQLRQQRVDAAANSRDEPGRSVGFAAGGATAGAAQARDEHGVQYPVSGAAARASLSPQRPRPGMPVFKMADDTPSAAAAQLGFVALLNGRTGSSIRSPPPALRTPSPAGRMQRVNLPLLASRTPEPTIGVTSLSPATVGSASALQRRLASLANPPAVDFHVRASGSAVTLGTMGRISPTAVPRSSAPAAAAAAAAGAPFAALAVSTTKPAIRLR